MSVYHNDYLADEDKIKQRGKDIDPDVAAFDGLRRYLLKVLWRNDENHKSNVWLKLIQQRRNTIHAYQDKEIDDFIDFRIQVRNYLQFLIDIVGRLPIPDEIFGPDLSLGYK